jgi:hypothetical protein
VSISAWGGPVFAPISAWVECRSRPRVEPRSLPGVECQSRPGVELDLGLGGAPISVWGGAPELDWVCVGIIFVIFCVEIVELSLCVVLFTV